MSEQVTRPDLDELSQAFDRMQHRFDGGIEILGEADDEDFDNAADGAGHDDFNESDAEQVDDLREGEDLDPVVSELEFTATGFVHLEMTARDTDMFLGRVVLYYNQAGDHYYPAVVTHDDAGAKQLTISDRPYVPPRDLREGPEEDPDVPDDSKKHPGISEGILFELGLKTETRDPELFGRHTDAGSLEAGHFAPALIAVTDARAADKIIRDGDVGTHSVGQEVGGVPEQMVESSLMPGVRIKTIPLNDENPGLLPLALHHSMLEDTDFGISLPRAEYQGGNSPVRLMLGSAGRALGDQAVDRVGTFLDDATRGAKT